MYKLLGNDMAGWLGKEKKTLEIMDCSYKKDGDRNTCERYPGAL